MNILIFICLFLGYLFIKIKENVHILQQNFYNENGRYIKWGIKNYYRVFNVLGILLCLISVINLRYKSCYLEWINVIYLGLLFNNYMRLKKKKVKIPFKVTNRVKRLFVTLVILYIIPLFIWNNDKYIIYFVYNFLILFNYWIVLIGNILNIPIEKIVFCHYKRMALKKIKKCSNLVVIGITGSYGKTSSKNILYEVLKSKYKVVMTPKNYNTLYGIMMTINNDIEKFDDIFISEMGAFKLGSIKKLCKLVHPKYAIITNIGMAHLETFRTRENIQRGKFELVEALPQNGVAILNMDDGYQVSYHIKNNIQIIGIGINNRMADVRAQEIMVTDNGSRFEVIFKEDDKSYLFQTQLLGRHNIYNILSAIALGRYLGISINELIDSIKRVKPIQHRLSIRRVSDLVIIDDAYNSNPVGAQNALDVLKMFEGIKIIITPGMIELGQLGEKYNKDLGKYMSKIVDYVILVGRVQTKAIYEGLMESCYNRSRIFVINDVCKAFPIIDKIKGKKYILLENDLPDIFSEN